MNAKIWGIAASIVTVLLWLWMIISLPSFRGFDSPEASGVRGTIVIVFTILSVVSLVSGILLIRQKK